MTKIIQKNMLEQYKEDTTAYAIYISRMRSTPSPKDGFKPIHRRILTTLALDCPVNSLSKSSSIVGKCMDMYHPHGDSSIYGAMKPMTNVFEIYIPLIEKQGNFGNIQGGRASDMRYTEAKISKFALDYVVKEMRESPNVVDWIPTYHNKHMEPEFLPASVPLLLINGVFGIALGLTSRIPKHNINEVIDATLKLIKNPDANVVLIPDQCTPCDIIETNFKSISNTGSGSFKVRGHLEYEEIVIDRKKVRSITIKSLPDLTYLDTVLKRIEELVEDKKLLDIIDIKDDSSEDVINCHLILSRTSDPNYVKDFLFKNTELEKTVSVSFEVIDGVELMRMSYKSYLQYFIEFRKLTKFRYYNNKLQDVRTKLHEKEAFIAVLESGELDDIIDKIRKQGTIDDVQLVEYLIQRLNITDLQASYIINANIKKLSIAYLNKYKEEAIEFNRLDKLYMDKIMNDNLLLDEIVEELKDAKKKYGKPRKCRVISKAEVSNIPQGEFTTVITDNNFVKKVPVNAPLGHFKGDSPKIIIKSDNTDNLIMFDEYGKVFKLPVHKIPVSDKNSNGLDIRKISNKMTSNIISVMNESDIKEVSKKLVKHFMVVLTHNGLIKRLDLDDFTTVPPSGILYNKLDNGDFVKEVAIVSSQSDVIVYSKNTASRMNINDIPHNKRNTKGSKSMAQDYVDGMAVIEDDTTDIIVLTEGGKVNKINTLAMPIVGRNKAGSKVIKLSKTDSIHSIKSVNKTNSKLNITTKQNKYSFDIGAINNGSSMSTGDKLISTKIDNILKCEIQ